MPAKALLSSPDSLFPMHRLCSCERSQMLLLNSWTTWDEFVMSRVDFCMYSPVLAPLSLSQGDRSERHPLHCARNPNIRSVDVKCAGFALPLLPVHLYILVLFATVHHIETVRQNLVAAIVSDTKHETKPLVSMTCYQVFPSEYFPDGVQLTYAETVRANLLPTSNRTCTDGTRPSSHLNDVKGAGPEVHRPNSEAERMPQRRGFNCIHNRRTQI
jgi:hypothetical protein